MFRFFRGSSNKITKRKGIPAITYFEPHFWQLRISGYCQLLEGMERFKPIHTVFRNIFIGLLCLYIIQTFIYTVQISDDLENFIQSLVTLFSYIPTVAKLVLYRLKEERINKLINNFNDPLFNQDCEDHKVMLQKSADNAARVLGIYFKGGILATFFWTMFPLSDFLSGKEASLGCYYGFDYNKVPYFYILLFYGKMLLFLLATGNTAMDCFISGVMGQCTTQIRILRYNLERLHQISEVQIEGRREDINESMNNELRKCILHLDKIYYIIQENENIFGRVVFLQLNMSGWIICVVAYRLVSVSGINFEFLFCVVFLILMIVEFFLYCYFGHGVKYESEQLIDSIYLMDWLETPVSFQKKLVILMERCKRPFAPTALKVIPLNLDTFLKILKSAYTFYTVLTKTQ